EFLVSSVCNVIDDVYLPKLDVPTRWIKEIPIKVNILARKISLDGLLTRSNLSSCGLDIPPILCLSCNEVVESTSHIFFLCSLARQVMSKGVDYDVVSYGHETSSEAFGSSNTTQLTARIMTRKKTVGWKTCACG
nr:RNA-directed DNA polymerase, eukaryota [Tanacetum cinerariifolium]